MPSGASAATDGADPLPPGFVRAESTEVAPGLVTERLVGTVDPQQIHVAEIHRGAGLSLRAVQAADQLHGSERASSMCARVGCLLGVNADFAHPTSGVPVGGLAVAGELVRSPNDVHQQLSVRADGTLTTERPRWSGIVMPTDLVPLNLDGVNVERGNDQLIMYSSHWGPTTRTNDFGSELVIEFADAARPLRVGATTAGRVVELRDGAGNTALGPHRLVVSGHGRAAERLRDLWQRIGSGVAAPTVLLRLDLDGAVQTVGGSHVLVRDGKQWVTDDGSGFVAGRHPRTLVGWRADGTTLLVTADGRQAGFANGLTLIEAARLMIDLGAVEAINLDGGGSTTFVEAGAVVNHPSDRLVDRAGRSAIVHAPVPGDVVEASVERPVVNALMVVPTDAATVPMPAPPEGVDIPVSVPDVAPVAVDPASNPLAALPAVIAEIAPPLPTPVGSPTLVMLVAAMLVAAVSGALAHHRLVWRST